MPKQKNKHAKEINPKIIQAQQRNEFFHRLKKVCDRVSNPAIFKLIPRKDLDRLYRTHIKPYRICPAVNMPSTDLKIAKENISLLFHEWKVSISAGEPHEVSLSDYYTFYLTLAIYGSGLKQNAYPRAVEVTEALSPLSMETDSVTYNEAGKLYCDIMCFVSSILSNLSTRGYTIKYNLRQQLNGQLGMFQCMEFFVFDVPTENAIIEEKKRPVFRVSKALSQPEPHLDLVSVSSQLFNSAFDMPLEVYIQQHALQRMAERMAGVDYGLLQENLYTSLKEPKMHRNKKGEFLLEYRFLKKKTGYLVAIIDGGRVIIRTFLFITNNGTPEGERLHANTGLMKEDKMYLAIDKLYTFVNSDISRNPKVKKIFLDAGCQSLFEVEQVAFWDSANEIEQTIAPLIEKHLCLNTNMEEIRIAS